MAGERILVVEDNAQSRRLAQFLLQARGYVVYEATTGEQALEITRRLHPDLVLMDVQLPELDGFAVTRALKEDAGTRGIPVVALTAYAMKGDHERALAAGCDGYITKPIDTKEFYRVLSLYLTSPAARAGSVALESQPTILVVDDNEQNLTLIRTILQRDGYEPLLARSGAEALEYVRKQAPDLIILDVMMPGMDGIEVCRRLKDDEETRLIPIVIMTALNQPEDKVRGIEAGADDFLTKPVSAAELTARVRTALKLKRTIDRKVGALMSIRDHLSKFVPLEVRRLIEEHPEAPHLEKQEKDVSILFVDVTGYTSLSLTMDPDRVNKILEYYFSHFLDCLHDRGGDIAETAGDGILVVFQHDDPLEHPKNAAAAALEILTVTDRLNRERFEAARPIGVHLALNSGLAWVGSTRFEGRRGTRWTFTATGPTTNLAARLGTIAAPGTIVVGPEAAKRLGDRFIVTSLGEHELKGLGPVEVYRLTGERS